LSRQQTFSEATRAAADLSLEPMDHRRLSNLCGPLNRHLHQVEQQMGVEICNRGNGFHVTGNRQSVAMTGKVIRALYDATQEELLSAERVHLYLQEAINENGDAAAKDRQQERVHIRKKTIRGRTDNQRRYLRNIRTREINFGIGPTGTGKTYLAVACAVAALEQERAQRIFLVRPAVEAGERLGFLPGDMAEKVTPFLHPLYDALNALLGHERVAQYLGQGRIEILPLAFMRGRTLEESFIILDEAQNATVSQIKMFLTRMGLGSKMVITGDITQVDLPEGKRSGLSHAAELLRGEAGISFTYFSSADVVRHPLVARILEAYARSGEDAGP